MKTSLHLLLIGLAIITTCPLHAQGPGRGRGGGGMPADFQDKIHQLFAHPEKILRTVDITETGYSAETTVSEPALAKTLQTHVKQMSGRLSEGMPVRRWDPAFVEFFDLYDEMQHTFTNLNNGIRAEVTGKSDKAIAVAHNHAYIILDFSSKGDLQMHQPHRTVLDDDGGEWNRFRGGPPDARAAELATTFGARAHDASDRLIKTLGGQLKAAMKAGGPEAALPVCATAAIPLTTTLNQQLEGLTVTRVTDRMRNPKNAPDEVDLKALKHIRHISESAKTPLAHLTTSEDGRSLRYYRPLVVSKTCLKCHGDRSAMSDKLRSLLSNTYPEDKAHGYALGDLRGLIRVERKASKDDQ